MCTPVHRSLDPQIIDGWNEPTEAREARSIDRQNNLRACPWRSDRPPTPILSLPLCLRPPFLSHLHRARGLRTYLPRQISRKVKTGTGSLFSFILIYTPSPSFSHHINLYSYMVYNFDDFYQSRRSILIVRIVNM